MMDDFRQQLYSEMETEVENLLQQRNKTQQLLIQCRKRLEEMPNEVNAAFEAGLEAGRMYERHQIETEEGLFENPIRFPRRRWRR
jgi:hypothetical protein